MEDKMLKYIALFEQDKEADLVGVVFPDLPGCFSSGKSFDEAFQNAHEALALYAEDVKEMPQPRTLEQIQTEWEDWKEWKDNYNFTVGMVGLLPPSQPRKYTLYIDAALMARIDEVSKNRSAFLSEAARTALDSNVYKKFASAE